MYLNVCEENIMNKRRNTNSHYQRRPVKRGTNASQPSIGAWLIALGLILAFVLSLFYLDHYRKGSPSAALHRLLNPKEQAKHSHPAPDFEFYTTLPSGKLTEMPAVTVAPLKPAPPPANAIVMPSTKTSASSATVSNNLIKAEPKPAAGNTASYFLQVAAFPHYAEADKLKAQLLLDNFNANVKNYKINNTEWYRVLVGPFHDLTALNQAQTALAALHYPSIRFQLTPSAPVTSTKK